MFLNLNRDKYLKDNELIQTTFISKTRQHQAVAVDLRNAIISIRCWLKQRSYLAKQVKGKIIPTGVETRTANDYIYHLIKNFKNNCNFCQIYNCILSYLNRLSRLKLQNFDRGSLIIEYTRLSSAIENFFNRQPTKDTKLTLSVRKKFFTAFLPLLWRIY